MQKNHIQTLQRLLRLPALRAGFGLVVLIVLTMANVGLTAIIVLPVRLLADTLAVTRKGMDAHKLLRETFASAVLLGMAAILAVFLDPSLHPDFPVAYGLAGAAFQVACAWAVIKSLWNHPLWAGRNAKPLHWSLGLNIGAFAALALLLISPLWGIATTQLTATVVMHLSPSL
ncbi:MAG: hypothetical protein KBC95_03660 [Candidatus Peribacteraceae bacterium]|nr:hypothetical protein [Candidatus Peribacteraceae bacterium]